MAEPTDQVLDEYDRLLDEREAKDREWLDKEAWREVVETVLENNSFVPKDAPKEVQSAEKNSPKMRFLRRMVGLAIAAAKDRGLRPGSHEANDLVDRAARIATNITSTFGEYKRSDEYLGMTSAEAHRTFAMTSTVRHLDLLRDTEKNGPLHVDRALFEYGVGEYLASEFRDPEVDKVLLYASADMEITAYIHAMVVKDIFTKKSRLQVQGVTAGTRWLKNRLIALGLTVVTVSAVLAGLFWFPTMPDVLALSLLGLAGLCIAGFVSFTLLSGLLLYKNAEKMNAPRTQMVTLIREAGNFFGEFRSPPILSLPHYRSRVDELKTLGMVWPQSLWAILDDLDQRGVKRL